MREGSPERINGPSRRRTARHPGGVNGEQRGDADQLAAAGLTGVFATGSPRTLAPSSSWTSLIARILTVPKQAGPPGAMTASARVLPTAAKHRRSAAMIAHTGMFWVLFAVRYGNSPA